MKTLNLKSSRSKKDSLYEIRIHMFNRIADTIEYLWGSEELNKYLNSLIIDSRGTRKGFPHSVFDALIDLYHIHESESGINNAPSTWEALYRR